VAGAAPHQLCDTGNICASYVAHDNYLMSRSTPSSPCRWSGVARVVERLSRQGFARSWPDIWRLARTICGLCGIGTRGQSSQQFAEDTLLCAREAVKYLILGSAKFCL